MNIYQSNTYRKDLSRSHFEAEPKVNFTDDRRNLIIRGHEKAFIAKIIPKEINLFHAVIIFLLL